MSGSTVIMQTITHLGIYLIQVVALWVYIRGHNTPGGGFIGGLVTAGAIALVAMTFGPRQAAAAIRPPAHHLIGAGLLLAVLTGVLGTLAGKPFLTHAFGHLHLPLIGDVEWATAALFDLGVYLGVVGTAKVILIILGGEAPSGAQRTGPGTSDTGRAANAAPMDPKGA